MQDFLAKISFCQTVKILIRKTFGHHNCGIILDYLFEEDFVILSLCHYSRLFTYHWLYDHDYLLEQDLPTDDVLVRSDREQNID